MRPDEYLFPYFSEDVIAVFNQLNELLPELRMPDPSSASEVMAALDLLAKLNTICQEFIDEAPDDFQHWFQDYPAVHAIFEKNLKLAENTKGLRPAKLKDAILACHRLLPYLIGTLLDRLTLNDQGEKVQVAELTKQARTQIDKALRI